MAQQALSSDTPGHPLALPSSHLGRQGLTVSLAQDPPTGNSGGLGRGVPSKYQGSMTFPGTPDEGVWAQTAVGIMGC